jgi:hypothetical protein
MNELWLGQMSFLLSDLRVKMMGLSVISPNIVNLSFHLTASLWNALFICCFLILVGKAAYRKTFCVGGV